MKVYVLKESIKNGLETMEGYILEENNKYNFKLQHDFSTNDYDYSESDITEEQEEILHNLIINGNYEK